MESAVLLFALQQLLKVTTGFIIRKFMSISKTLPQYVKDGAFENTKNASFHIMTPELIEKHLQHTDGLRIDEDDAELLDLLYNKNYERFFERAIQLQKKYCYIWCYSVR